MVTHGHSGTETSVESTESMVTHGQLWSVVVYCGQPWSTVPLKNLALVLLSQLPVGIPLFIYLYCSPE